MVIQLTDDEIDIVKSILQKNISDVEIWVFGSRTILTADKYSDLDLLLKGRKTIPLSTLAILTEDFSESSLPFKVELIDWFRITPAFRQQIQKNRERLI